MPTADNEKHALSKPGRRRGQLPFVLAALLLSLLALHLYPERSTTTRLLLVGNALLLWTGLLVAGWRVKYCRAAWFLVTAGATVFLLLPGRYDSAGLRRDYVPALLRYEGTPYYWGGETSRGVDCSGLMRCALVDTLLRRGLTTMNPHLVRAGISLWWHDAGATVMQQGYQGRTHLVFETSALNTVTEGQLYPGEMAVLNGGGHIMAYVGNSTWIEADPNERRVVLLHAPSTNTWLNQHAVVIMWGCLEPQGL